MTQPGSSQVPGYPIDFDVEPQLTDRNRLTTGFRLILGIPQIHHRRRVQLLPARRR